MRERRRNPFVTSSRGGRTLSALQLPWFLLAPPKGYGVLTTTGRRTGRRRRRCVRAIRDGDRVYLLAIKGVTTTGWAKNVRANPDIEIRIRGGTFTARAYEVGGEQLEMARRAYCETVVPFDRLTYTQWRTGMPRAPAIRAMLSDWYSQGAPIVAHLQRRS